MFWSPAQQTVRRFSAPRCWSHRSVGKNTKPFPEASADTGPEAFLDLSSGTFYCVEAAEAHLFILTGKTLGCAPSISSIGAGKCT